MHAETLQGAEVGKAKPYIPPYLQAQNTKSAAEHAYDLAMTAPSQDRDRWKGILPFLLGALVGFALSALRARR